MISVDKKDCLLVHYQDYMNGTALATMIVTLMCCHIPIECVLLYDDTAEEVVASADS